MAVEPKPMWTQNPKELVYLAVFYVVGFALLKYIRREKAPMKFKNAKLVYNTAMSAFSFYLFYAVLRQLIKSFVRSKTNTLICDSELEMFDNLEWYFLIFYYSKYIEYIDTFFLVMANVADLTSVKMRLHLWHHLITPTIVYTTWFYPCTGGWIGPLTNGFVHFIMYGYYGISVVFPEIKKWGNYVTYVQLIQFVTVVVYHSIWVIPSMLSGCEGNGYQLTFNLANYLIFLVLFLYFYFSKNSKSPVKSNGSANGTVNKGTPLSNGIDKGTPLSNGIGGVTLKCSPLVSNGLKTE